jgi:hypothetical protein
MKRPFGATFPLEEATRAGELVSWEARKPVTQESGKRGNGEETEPQTHTDKRRVSRKDATPHKFKRKGISLAETQGSRRTV